MKNLLKKLKKYAPKRELSWWKKIGLWLLIASIGLFLAGMITVVIAITILSAGLPDVTDLENLSPAQSTEIFDKEGSLLYTIHGEENREQVAYAEISPYLINATVSIEDDSFWEHHGFDFAAIVKAGMYEVFGIGSPRGGSTITQQYIKNTFLSSERSYTRKIKELILAIRLEKHYKKTEILGLYLNRIPYGNNAYGCETAAEIYFNKTCKDLDLAESAALASLPQAPSRYNPYGDNKYSHLLKEFSEDELSHRKIDSERDLKIGDDYVRGLIGKHVSLGETDSVYIQGRTDFVLKRMYDLEKINMEERQEALNELQVIEFNQYKESIKYPHFVLYIKQQLEDKYGKDVVERGGLKVYTTIDPAIQEAAEEAAKKYGESNESTYGANNLAIFSINAKTGEILSMVGSRDYFNEDIDGNVNVVFRPRQPGSSFKPFVYAQAFYNGYAPGSVVYDIPMKLGSKRPQNYDGSWKGQINLRQGLAQSRNIPAIKAYYLAGEQGPIIDLVEKMGITTLDKGFSYGYPLALGSGEVPLAEMVTAFGTFANNGKKPELTAILKVENSNGDILEEWKQKEFEEVLDPQIAYLINDILSDQENSIGPRLFVNGKINAAKTGTSTKENKQSSGGSVRPSDTWTIGYTPTIVTGVWTGNTDGKGLNYNANGYDTAAPIFNAVMTEALKGTATEPFPRPEGIIDVKISKASGKLPGPTTPEEMITSDIFTSFSEPTEVEDIFKTVKIDKVSGKLATEFTPDEAIEEVTFQNYEPIADMFNWVNEVRTYFEDKEGEINGIRISLPPTQYDDVHTAETANQKPTITIISPTSQGSVPQGNFTVDIDIDSLNDIERVEYYIDDEKKFFTTTAPYTGHLTISKFMQEGSTHLIVAKVIDGLGYSGSSAREIKVGEQENTPEPTPDSLNTSTASSAESSISKEEEEETVILDTSIQ